VQLLSYSKQGSTLEAFLKGRPFYERWFFKLASKGLYPTILSAIGFSYISIPSNLQETIRRALPLQIREHMLMLLTTEGWLIALLAFTVVCAIWGGVGSNITVWLIKKKHKAVLDDYELLKQDRDSKSINCYRLFSNYLYGYYERFGLTTNERISLYKLDMDRFSCIGRHSDNEIFKAKPNRLYPKDEGCIAKAWQVGKVQDADAPYPEENMASWINYNIDKFNFSEETLTNIKMKSRSFYGFRLRNTQNETIAVLMFESLDVDGLKFGKFDRFFNEHEKKNITHLIESLEKHIPSLEMARLEGF
jgi:hypothetical protein